MAEGQPKGLKPEEVVRETAQINLDAIRVPRSDAGRFTPGYSRLLGGIGIDHRVTGSVVRMSALEEPHGERGPNGL